MLNIKQGILFTTMLIIPLFSYAKNIDSRGEEHCQFYANLTQQLLTNRMGGETKNKAISLIDKAKQSKTENADIDKLFHHLLDKSVNRAYSVKIYSGNFAKNLKVSKRFFNDEKNFCLQEFSKFYKENDRKIAEYNAKIQALKEQQRSRKGVKHYGRYKTEKVNGGIEKYTYTVQCLNGTSGLVNEYPTNDGYNNIYWKNYDRDSSQHHIFNGSVQDAIQKVCQ